MAVGCDKDGVAAYWDCWYLAEIRGGRVASGIFFRAGYDLEGVAVKMERVFLNN